MSYESLLRRVEAAGVYDMPQGDSESLVVAADANGYAVFRVDLGQAGDKESLLAAIARDLALWAKTT